MSDVILKARGLEKRYAKGEAEAAALRGLDLDFVAGEYAVIMGSSGSGKSTLLFLLSGLDRPSAGSVEFEGRRIDDLGEERLARLRRDGFGFVFQAVNLIGDLSFLENVLAEGLLGKRERESLKERSMGLLRSLGVEELADRLPAEASGGQQQRAAVARALVNRPRVLFADEPTGALDFMSGQALLDSLDEVSRAGQTIVMVTHDLKSASRGDRIIFLRDGMVGGEFRFRERGLGSASPAERERALFAWLSAQGW